MSDQDPDLRVVEGSALPGQPPALVRILAAQLVGKKRQRIIDPMDSRLGKLAGMFQFVVGTVVSDTSMVTGFLYDTSSKHHGSIETAAAEAAVWRASELAHRKKTSAITIVVIEDFRTRDVADLFSDKEKDYPGVTVYAVNAGAQKVTRPLSGVKADLSLHEVRHALAESRTPAKVPELAAIGLAEQQLMHNSVAGIPAGFASPTNVRAFIPWVTYGLIASWVLICGAEFLYAAQPAYQIVNGSSAVLYNFGALTNAHWYSQDWWRIISSGFVHDDTTIFHVGLNGLSMFFLGTLVERIYGRWWLFLVWILGVIGGSVLWLVTTPPVSFDSNYVITSFGASGGIIALLGLLIMLGRFQTSSLNQGFVTSIRNQAITWGVFNVVSGIFFTGLDINVVAHVGGIVVGIALGVVAAPVRMVGGKGTPKAVIAFTILMAAVTLVSLGFAADYLFKFPF